MDKALHYNIPVHTVIVYMLMLSPHDFSTDAMVHIGKLHSSTLQVRNRNLRRSQIRLRSSSRG